MSKLYIFDMGEVVLLGVKTLNQMAAQYGLDYDSFRADYSLYDKPLMDGYMEPDNYYRHMEKKYGIKIDEDLFLKYFNPSLNEELILMVQKLRKRGDRAVIGSNTFAPHWEIIFERFKEIPENFDALYASHLMHISKPEEAFWRIICEKERKSYIDTFFIDDRQDNISAARGLGINVHRYLGDNKELAKFLEI